MSPLTLVINLSLRSAKIIALDASGKKCYEDWMPVRTYLNGQTIEQDPNEWWQLVLELLEKISKKPFFSEIEFVTVTSSALCLVLLDKKGNVIDKAIMVSDKRAILESQLLKEKFTEFFTRSMQFKPDPSYMMPKILWLKYNNLRKFKKIAYFLSSNDFLLYKLTGKIVTDTLNAEKFYYFNNSFPKALLKFIGIKEKNLPKVVSPGTIIGDINVKLKKKFLMRSGTKVIVSTYDAICALIGGSKYEEGELDNVCGTCSSYRLFSKTNHLVHENLIVQKLPGERFFIIGGSNNLEAGIIEWAKECFYGDNYLKDDTFLYSLIEKEARESELGANGIVFLPYLLGERMPFVDPDVRGTFFGLERFHSRKDIMRSIFEAVCFQAKLVLDEFEKNGFAISSIVMSGGLAKISFTAQLRADILGLPIYVLKEKETTALGAFILTLKARKKVRTIEDAKGLIVVEKRYLPNMHNHNCYASLFMLYKELYIENKFLYQKRKETLEKISNYRKRVLENL